MPAIHGAAIHGAAIHGVSRRRAGVTLVELLVALALLGMLIGLLLPAVQMAREAAWATECKSHLRQIGIAATVHHDLHQQLPTNGWGYRWIGQWDRGFGPGQPGGWVFNLLPFVEQSALRELAVGASPPQRTVEMQRLLQTPISLFHCPSRRAASAHEYRGRSSLRNAVPPLRVAKCDYAGNGGHVPFPNTAGPVATTPAALRRYRWPNGALCSGLFFVRSRIRLADITDGTSNVYLVGEKYVRRDIDTSYRDVGDDQTMFLGDDTDIRRWTSEPPRRDARGVNAPLRFGSSHPEACHLVFADGSVRAIGFTIDADVHRRLGNRSDGQPAGDL